jgi:ATP-dependent RNA helicase SUPV3L1/SUV3
VRADLAERLGWEISKRRREADKPAFELPAELASVVSCPGEEFPAIVKGFGLAPAEKDPETGVVTLWRYLSRNRQDGPPRGRPGTRDNKPGAPPRGKGGPRKGPKGPPKRGPQQRQPDPDSPFAALASLLPPPPPPKPKKKKKQPAKAPSPEAAQGGKNEETDTAGANAAETSSSADGPAPVRDTKPAADAPGTLSEKPKDGESSS